MNKNYLKIFAPKNTKNHFIKNILWSVFSKIQFSKKQIIMLCVACFGLGFAFYMKLNAQNTIDIPNSEKFEEISVILKRANIFPELIGNWTGLNIIKIFLEWISEIQANSIDTVNKMSFGDMNMFDFLVDGLTIFAVIGCLYRLIVHFLNTEKFDNVKAYTGFFSYIGIGLLFLFSSQIVDRIVSLNEPLNSDKMKEMTQKLNNELNNTLVRDLKVVHLKIEETNKKVQQLENKKENETIAISTNLEILKENLYLGKLIVIDGNFSLLFKYAYFSIFIMLLSSIMAIPGFILSVMIKVLLTIMVAGTKLVFLLAFIPGFENTWKTFILNMLNILLWIPIFNAVYSLIVTLIITLMSDESLGNGQIVWLTIVSLILAQQSISLTTSAAGVIINGTGATMAGAMGAMSAMSGTSMAMGVAKGAVGVASSVAGGAVGASIGASKLGEYMKK